ncbi:MAG: DUF6291 domain-containing protein [Muribaculaceae bacterium]
MNAQNITLKANWIERIDKLNPEQRQLTVMAIYDYMVYGKLSNNNYVNFAISWIRDEIDRERQARERREARRRERIEQKRREAEAQKDVSEENAAEQSDAPQEPSEEQPATLANPDLSPGHFKPDGRSAGTDYAQAGGLLRDVGT